MQIAGSTGWSRADDRIMDRNNPRDDNPRRKVNDAIERGLNLCRHSVAPIVSLAFIVDELRADPTWTAKEVHQVEITLRKMLAGIVNR